MSQFYLDPVGGYTLVAVVAAVLLGLVLWGPDRARTSPRQRWMLAGLRLAVIVVLVMTMLRPARVITEVKEQTATLVLLLDRSRSMQVADGLDGRSRWELLRASLEDAAPQLAELGEKLELKAYAFDADVNDLEIVEGNVSLADSPQGQESAIGAALAEVMQREVGKRLVGVLLLSDGAQRAYPPRDMLPQSAVTRLVDAQYPLYTLAFGQPRGVGQARDVAIEDLITSSTVFVKNVLQVSGSLDSQGYASTAIPVQLLFETAPGKMEAVSTREVRPQVDGARVPLDLAYEPQVAGEFKVTLRAVPQDGELVTTNNELSTFVTVRKGGINALYLEGALRVEQRFVRASIDASPDIKLDYQRIDRRQFDDQPVDLGDRFQPGKYDVYIIGDLDSRALGSDDWQDLADRVNEGAGLIMLGGFHSFGPGGYRNTALVDVLPIEMGTKERQNFGEPVSSDLHYKGPLKMIPTQPVGARHPVMALAAGPRNLELWRELPALDGANRFLGLKPRGVLTLAVSDDERKRPLLVSGGWGGGRVLAFAGDSTWRWCLEGHEMEHRRFWRQVVLWLAHKDDTDDTDVWIRLDRRRFRPGDPVRFVVGANDRDGRPLTNAAFSAEIVAPDDTRLPARLAKQGNETVGIFTATRQSGDYAIELEASVDRAPVGSARTRFLIPEQDLELDRPAANPSLLANLAGRTEPYGGKALAAEELPDLLREIGEQPLELEVERQVKFTYWDKWPVLLAFVTLICTEWFLRKRWGLV